VGRCAWRTGRCRRGRRRLVRWLRRRAARRCRPDRPARSSAATRAVQRVIPGVRVHGSSSGRCLQAPPTTTARPSHRTTPGRRGWFRESSGLATGFHGYLAPRPDAFINRLSHRCRQRHGGCASPQAEPGRAAAAADGAAARVRSAAGSQRSCDRRRAVAGRPFGGPASPAALHDGRLVGHPGAAAVADEPRGDPGAAHQARPRSRRRLSHEIPASCGRLIRPPRRDAARRAARVR
jgi:hypothetical protein